MAVGLEDVAVREIGGDATAPADREPGTALAGTVDVRDRQAAEVVKEAGVLPDPGKAVFLNVLRLHPDEEVARQHLAAGGDSAVGHGAVASDMGM